jgi:diguanylate cyclase (GGDEF)-like protein
MFAGAVKTFRGMPHLVPMLFALGLAIIQTGVYIVFQYAPEPHLSILCYFLLLPVKSSLLVALLIFAVKYTSPFYKFSARLLVLLFVVPGLTAALLFTNENHGLLYESALVLRYVPVKEIAARKSLWYYVNFIYMYLAASAAVYIYVCHYNAALIVYKFKLRVIMLAYGLYLVLDLLQFFDIHNGFDIAVLDMFAPLALGYWAVVIYRGSNLLMLARNTVFEKISCVALILEHDGTIIDANPCAQKTFATVWENLVGRYYSALIKDWLARCNGTLEHTDSGAIITITGEDGPLYYQVNESEISNHNGMKIGNFVEIRDITAQRMLYLEMFHAANYDQLTGLYNRRYYDLICEKYDLPKYYPLAFISGDLNYLKRTNDTFGHMYGDRLLMKISGILTKAAPERAIICRAGGDEFFVLIPNCGEDEAAEYLRQVSALCAQSAEPFGAPDISMGFHIKRDAREKIHEAMLNADLIMYENKRKHKAAGNYYKLE